MKPVKYLLIMNPRSKGGKAAKRFDAITRLMTEAGLDFENVIAETYGQIRTASAKANEGKYDVIVAVGGDGTINATMNGFFDSATGVVSGKMFGVIYSGTSPDFCKSYGVPTDLAGAVNALKMLKVREISIGCIQFAGSPVGENLEKRYFSCCASIGIGAMVAEKANRYRKFAGDIPGTFGAICSSLFTFHPFGMRIRVGPDERDIRGVTNVFVGRTKYIASGLRVNEAIADDDSRFYILIVKDLNLWRLPGLLKQLYTGNLSGSGVMEILYNDIINIETENHTRVEFDGDAAGFTPCSIYAAPSTIRLITH